MVAQPEPHAKGYQTLTQALEELERTDPAVRKAKENYERVKERIIERGRTNRQQRAISDEAPEAAD